MSLPETQLQLVLRLADASDQAAWQEFQESYAPFLEAFFRRRDCQSADAQDLTQQVLLAVARKVGDWSPDGRPESFRRWLLTIARRVAIKFWLRQEGQPDAPGGTDFLDWLQQLPEKWTSDEQTALVEFRALAFQWALEEVRQEVRPATWTVFERTSLRREEIAAVARDLGLSLGAAYMARSRVMSRLRALVRKYEPDDLAAEGTP